MKKILAFIVLVITIPTFVIHFFFNYSYEKIKTGFNTNKEKQVVRVKRSNGTVENLDLEEYLIGVVSAEVPVTFEKEAIKAQTVAARTYAMKQIQNSTNRDYDVTDDTLSQVYQDDNKLKEKWQNKYNEYINKIKECVNETEGEYITYNNEVIYAFFFSTSNGKTEDNKDVFGQDLPYLKVVDSSFDANETRSFQSQKEFTKQEFYQKLEIPYSDKLNISNVEKTSSGRVKNITLNNVTFKGRTFQSKLSLRSNDFEISETNEKIIVTTKGYGHGVGMSQYGANALAKQNKNYKEILKYYYQGTQIEKL